MHPQDWCSRPSQQPWHWPGKMFKATRCGAYDLYEELTASNYIKRYPFSWNEDVKYFRPAHLPASGQGEHPQEAGLWKDNRLETAHREPIRATGGSALSSSVFPRKSVTVHGPFTVDTSTEDYVRVLPANNNYMCMHISSATWKYKT